MSCHGPDPLFRIASYGLVSLLGIVPAFGSPQDAVQYSIGALLIVQTALIVALGLQNHRRRSARRGIGKLHSAMTHENRMALTGQITSSIAHELAQPLSAILSNVETAELLLTRPESNRTTLGEILADIKRDNSRATEITHRMRALLRNQELQFELLDLNEVVASTLALIRDEAARHNIVIEAKLGRVPPTQADAVHLQQVLINLLLNAKDAMMKTSPLRRVIRVHTSAVAGEIEVTVSDTGCGMSADQISKAFESFFTTKQGGAGLGLSIARSIVQAHGGTFSVQSLENRGAVFRFTLPVRRDPRPSVLPCAAFE